MARRKKKPPKLSPRRRQEMKLLDKLKGLLPDDEWREILEGQPDIRFQSFMKMMYDPAFNKYSLTNRAIMCGLTFHELSECIHSFYTDQGRIRQAKHLPQIMEDDALAALARFEMCDKCEGTGSVAEKGEEGETIPVTCKKCGGKGEVRVAGDSNAINRIYKTAGLIDSARGPLIDARTTNVLSTGEDGLEDLLKLSKKRNALPSGEGVTVVGTTTNEKEK